MSYFLLFTVTEAANVRFILVFACNNVFNKDSFPFLVTIVYWNKVGGCFVIGIVGVNLVFDDTCGNLL